ncbi:hypothetical protein WDZ92_27885, partial [Nostoc sp. NIES-2111]
MSEMCRAWKSDGSEGLVSASGSFAGSCLFRNCPVAIEVLVGDSCFRIGGEVKCRCAVFEITGIKTEYSYDQHKRVSQMRKLPNGSTENRCERVDYFYDENGGTNNGRLTRMRWGWDASNNPCVDAATNFNIGFEESYTYNAAGRTSTKVLAYRVGTNNTQ